MFRLSQSHLLSPKRFKEELKKYHYIRELQKRIQERFSARFDEEEVSDLLLSLCRSGDFEITQNEGKNLYLIPERIWLWVENKLIPNFFVLRLDDEDVIRLLIFSFEITYQMFSGGTVATISSKGFRERRRTFEAIVVDNFVGKLGEIVLKKFLENSFKCVKVEIDWEISRNIEKYRNDILNAKKLISIKSTPTLAGVWAEAPKNYDYGILVKCSIPQPTILQFFVEVCGFSRLLEFAENKIPAEDVIFQGYLEEIKERLKGYKCGEMQSNIKGIVCGYFKTAPDFLRKEGEELRYLGKVREERYIINIKDLRWTKTDWQEFLSDVGLI